MVDHLSLEEEVGIGGVLFREKGDQFFVERDEGLSLLDGEAEGISDGGKCLEIGFEEEMISLSKSLIDEIAKGGEAFEEGGC